ncbi:MAG: cell division ATP-binding protein FtsE [Intrasporangiaceae bacterium]|nr:cell division ATP-binding protein FtsE [Intrasporangiaceae bacterium]
MIRLQNVTKTYKRGGDDEVIALNDVSLEINKGEFVFIVGPSGSGKSTFMKLLTREQLVDSGDLWVAGKDLNAIRSWKIPALRRDIGYVFQDFKLLPNKSVRENVAFALEVIGKSRREIETRVPEVLELVGIDEKANAMPHELSGGQQQRVSIARAFVNNPRILLCDEPTGNLDPSTSVGIMKLLDRINRTGATVVMATHDQHIVDSMRRRVIELENGLVVRDQSRGVYGYAG